MSEAVRAVVQDRVDAEVVGYVEAMTDTAALGWVWRPGLNERVTVELRFGEQTVGQARADGIRDDLARSGIGDGRHAFSLSIPDAMRSRLTELRVFAVREGGAAVMLGAPPVIAPEAAGGGLVAIQRGVDMLIGSQRLMHRNLQTALLQQTPSLSSALAEIAVAQAALQESIGTFELFAIRLEQALASREAPTGANPARRALVIVASVASLALFASCMALWHTMVR